MSAPSTSQANDQNTCRLCHAALDICSTIEIGPFPKAAQYYPEPAEFADDKGVMLRIIECPDCGLTQLRNPPVDYYRQVITAASLSPAVREQRLALFQSLRPTLSDKPLKALEIGCARGDNLPLLHATGFHAQGLECSPEQSPNALSEEGILNTYLLDLPAEHHGQYDLLVSFNYLEHQPDARAFLRQCHALLAEEGRLLLTVPNFDFLLESKSAHEFVTDHLLYFTAQSLETALRICGFTLIDLQIINNQYDIQVIAQRRPPSHIQACRNELAALCTQLNDKLAQLKASGKKVAVWGAGHRTLALLSRSNYQDIHCIIDSAPFKHFKFAPISHLQIFPPEILLDDDCDIEAILVMVPGIYPKEVLKRIHALPRHYHAEEFPLQA